MFGAQGRTTREGQGGREQLHCVLPRPVRLPRDGSATSACLVVIL
jgi:hypothetical protein